MAVFVVSDHPDMIRNTDVFGFAYQHYQIGTITGDAGLMRAVSTDGRLRVDYHGSGLTAAGATGIGGQYTELRAFLDGVEIVRLTDFGTAEFSQIATNTLALEVLRNQPIQIHDGAGSHRLIGGAQGTEFFGLQPGDLTQGGSGGNVFHAEAAESWTYVPRELWPGLVYQFRGSDDVDRVVFHGNDHPGGFVDARSSYHRTIEELEFHDGVTAVFWAGSFALGSIGADVLDIYGTARIIITDFINYNFSGVPLYADPTRMEFHDVGPHTLEIRGIHTVPVTGNAESFDRLIAHASADATLIGAGGGDWLEGRSGDDRLVSGGVGDTLIGGGGDDTFVMNDARDVILNNVNDGVSDWLLTSVSVDLQARDVRYMRFIKAEGTAPVDIVAVLDISTIVIGNMAGNRLEGGRQWEKMFGWRGHDTLIGGGGADTLNGGTWGDRLIGGALSDTFVMQDNGGLDRIMDFDTAGADHDILDLQAVSTIRGFADLMANHVTIIGDGVRISYDGYHRVDLVGVARADLSADLFLFAGSV